MIDSWAIEESWAWCPGTGVEAKHGREREAWPWEEGIITEVRARKGDGGDLADVHGNKNKSILLVMLIYRIVR